MMTLRGDDFVFLAMCIGAAGMVFGLLRRQQEIARERLKVLDKALQHPNLDAVTRTELTRLLSREAHQRWEQRLARYLPLANRIWLGAAWTTFVGSLAFAGFFAATDAPDHYLKPCFAFAILGFLGLSLPLAVGELTRSRNPAQAPR